MGSQGVPKAPTCAVGVGLDVLQDTLDVLRLGQVHLQQGQHRRAAPAQLLGAGTLWVQHAGEHPKAHGVQVPRRRLPETGVAACESREEPLTAAGGLSPAPPETPSSASPSPGTKFHPTPALVPCLGLTTRDVTLAWGIRRSRSCCFLSYRTREEENTPLSATPSPRAPF